MPKKPEFRSDAILKMKRKDIPSFALVLGQHRLAVMPLIVVLLLGCSEQSGAPNGGGSADSATDPEFQLMQDTPRAGKELIRRLTERVRRSGNVLVVQNADFLSSEVDFYDDKDFVLTALPASAPWSVKCRHDRLAVAFGMWMDGTVTTDGNDLGPAALVSLTTSQLSKERCAVLAEQVANALVDLVSSGTADRQSRN